MEYADYSTLIDTGLVIAVVLIVWAGYREMRRRKRDNHQSSHMSNSSAA